MSVAYKDNTLKLSAQFGQRANVFIRLMMDEVEGIADPNTPRRDGPLRQSKVKTVKRKTGTMIWRKKYAAAQEAGQIKRGGQIIVFKNYTTPGTGPHFAHNATKEVQTSAVTKKVGRASGLIR